MSVYILIPAYKPDEKLIHLLEELGTHIPVLVVDDGSGSEYEHIFEKAHNMGAKVLHHKENMGKGAALKTGIKFLSETNASGIITADSDGQHTPADIRRIAEAMQNAPSSFITGGRNFSKMPLRSKLGNTLTYLLFRASTGIKIKDTQTGLRGIPRCLFDKVLSIDGDRYEYEMNVLLNLKEWNAEYLEIPISTIYLDQNKSSHFQPIGDGLKVFIRVILYALSSLSCTLVDYVIYITLISFKLLPAQAYAIARVCSSALNYQVNCRVVFKGKPTLKSALEYVLLVLIILIIGSVSVTFLTSHNINGVVAKMIIDCLLFITNYIIQKKVIFAAPRTKRD